MDGMDCTGNGQKSLETMESHIRVSSKARLDLANEIDGENHGLGVAKLCLSNSFSSLKYFSVGTFC